MLYSRILWPLLLQWDAERTHEFALRLLETAQRQRFGRAFLSSLRGQVPCRPVEALGLRFPNILGVAAGFDKDARAPLGLALLGFGHVEVGTLTPRPQSGNPRPRLFRLPADGALINRMGFPNPSVEAVVPRLRALTPRQFIVGVSLGKQSETPLEEAGNDYLQVMGAVYPHADYLVVNVSSPNTPGLRQLQSGDYLRPMLARLQTERRSHAEKLSLPAKPLLVKVSPDLEAAGLEAVVEVALDLGIEGIIATNTTISRVGLNDENRAEAGGLSGRPLAERSNQMIARIRAMAGDQLTIIGAGGVFSSDDVRAKVAAGASLIQVYTGFVYGGPRWPGRILRDLQ